MGNQSSIIFGEYEEYRGDLEEEEEEEDEEEKEEGAKDGNLGTEIAASAEPPPTSPPDTPTPSDSKPIEEHKKLSIAEDGPAVGNEGGASENVNNKVEPDNSRLKRNGKRRRSQSARKISRDKKTDETVLRELMQELDAFKRLEMASSGLEPERPAAAQQIGLGKSTATVEKLEGAETEPERKGIDIALPIANKKMLASGELRGFRKLRLSEDDTAKDSLNKSWREELSASFEGAEEVSFK